MIEDKNTIKTSLEKLGEFGLIAHLTKDFPVNHKSTVKAIGDDAAVLDFKSKKTVVSTDLLIEGIHFDLSYMPLKHLGYKAVMVNLSDIYAMNAVATQITVSIAVSNRFPLEALEELYAGIHMACKTYGVDLIGGDTTSSKTGMLLSVTAIGEAEDADSQPDLDPYSYIIERQLKPEARKDMATLLQKLEVQPTAMIDISDGLSSEILHLCKKSDVGCNLYEDKIPLDPTVIASCEEFKMDSTMVALSGGEDYELLFTIKQTDFDKIKGNPHLTVIGYMTNADEGANLITRAETKIPLTAQGWNSFDNS